MEENVISSISHSPHDPNNPKQKRKGNSEFVAEGKDIHIQT